LFGSSRASEHKWNVLLALLLTIVALVIPTSMAFAFIYFPVPFLILAGILIFYGLFMSIYKFINHAN